MVSNVEITGINQERGLSQAGLGPHNQQKDSCAKDKEEPVYTDQTGPQFGGASVHRI